MKAGRYLAGRAWLGWGNLKAFDDFYDDKLLQPSSLNSNAAMRLCSSTALTQ